MRSPSTAHRILPARLAWILTAKWVWILGATLVIGAVASAAGRAQEPRDTTAEARTHLASGVAAARRGAWVEARQAFQSAYRLKPHPAVLFNLAGAQSRTGRLLVATANYRRVLQARRGLANSHRAACRAQITSLEARIPRLKIEVLGLEHDDRVILDRTRLYPNELEMEQWVDPGKHELTVFRASGEQQTKRVSLAERQRKSVVLRL